MNSSVNSFFMKKSLNKDVIKKLIDNVIYPSKEPIGRPIGNIDNLKDGKVINTPDNDQK